MPQYTPFVAACFHGVIRGDRAEDGLLFCYRVPLRLVKTEAVEEKCPAREQFTEVHGFRHNQKLPGGRFDPAADFSRVTRRMESKMILRLRDSEGRLQWSTAQPKCGAGNILSCQVVATCRRQTVKIWFRGHRRLVRV